MLKRTLLQTAAGLVSMLLAVALPAGAQNRLPQVIPAGSARVSVANTVNRKVKLSTDLGAVNANQSLALSLRFNMTTAQTAALQQLLANQQNPSSPQYHQWLTPQQFGAQFGLSTTDLATVSSWLQAQGFTVTGIANGRTFISFTGTVGQAEQAFGTSIHSLKYNGEARISNVTDPTLPATIAQVTTGITGLNDFRVQPRVHRRQITASADLATAKFNGAAAGYGNLLAPGDFYTIYDENKLLSPSTGTPINGAGVTIAVMGQVGIYSSDIAAFRTASGLSTTNLPTQVTEGTTPPAPTAAACGVSGAPSTCDDLYESSLDLEWSGASAPNASILFVTGQDVFANAMTQAIDQNLAPILTVSYGDCEANFNQGPPTTETLNTLFMQANAQGQTVLGPSGDSGATDCDYNESLATQGLAVDFPASSPYVTAVGGTQFADAGGTYWNTTDGANAGSAISYIPEQPWNEFFQTVPGTTELAGLTDGAGGGGVSQLFSKPYWQKGSGVPADASRDVPDVAYAAAANHDGYLYCVFGSCSNGGFSYTTTSTTGTVTNYEVAGGTSFATPIFAGTLALVEQKTGGKLGNANPAIYGLANSSYLDTVFHDKTTGGNNAAPCEEGTPNCNPGFPNFYAAGALACPANSCGGTINFPAIGYVAGSGYVYDTATGWGSVDVANLVNDWTLATPIAATTTSSNDASSVTVTTTTSSITAGAAISVTAKVASAASVTTTPTGTVTLLVDGVVEGSAATLSGGTATLTYTTPSTIASGTHTVSVSYSGDTVYAGSIGSVSVDVTSASGGSQDFSLTPASSTISVALGGTTSPITYTVTSVNGFAGSVTFSASTTNATLNDDAAISFSVSPVTVTATTPGTTAFTLYAYYNATTGLFRQGKVKRLGAAGSAHNLPAPNPWALAGSGVALAGLMLFGLPRRRRNRWSALLVAVFTVAVLSAAGCSGASGTAGGNDGNINVPAGTYPVTITATGTTTNGVSVSHSANITLTIQ